MSLIDWVYGMSNTPEGMDGFRNMVRYNIDMMNAASTPEQIRAGEAAMLEKRPRNRRVAIGGSILIMLFCYLISSLDDGEINEKNVAGGHYDAGEIMAGSLTE